VQLGVVGGVSVTFDGGVGAVDYGENGFFLVGGSVDANVKKSCRCLKTIQEARGEVGVLERALSKAWIWKLAKNSILTTKEEDVLFGVVKHFVGFGNGWKDFGLLVWSLLLLGYRCVSCRASHFDGDVAALRGDVVEVGYEVGRDLYREPIESYVEIRLDCLIPLRPQLPEMRDRTWRNHFLWKHLPRLQTLKTRVHISCA
jgi:hypothetical protein